MYRVCSRAEFKKYAVDRRIIIIGAGKKCERFIEEFDVDSVLSKGQQDLSGVLVLGSIAGEDLKEYYE